MTNGQLTLMIGIQSTVVLIGMLVNVIWFRALIRRLDRMIAGMEARHAQRSVMGNEILPGLRNN